MTGPRGVIRPSWDTLDPDEVQYMGTPHDLRSCLLAIDTIVNSERPPKRASLVTWAEDRPKHLEKHLFLFWSWKEARLTVVRSAFTSGYSGEGPRALSVALCMIWDKGVPMDQLYVSEDLFNAINRQHATEEMLNGLRVQGELVEPWTAHYVRAEDKQMVLEQTFWPMWHTPGLAFDFLDAELAERCHSLYPDNVGSAIREAYILVEERLRALIGSSSTGEETLSGQDLISGALHPENGILTDRSLPRSERDGLFLMFKGSHMYVRNPRAHRFVDEKDPQCAIEFICLADLLLRLLPADQACIP